MKKITEDMMICQVMDMDPNLESVFISHGLNCVGCPGSNTENLKEAAEGHDIDLVKLLEDLNRVVK